MATGPNDPSNPTDERVPFPAIDLDQLDPDNIDQVLTRADALLSRNRASSGASISAAGPPEPSAEFPVLTEVVPAPRKPATAQDLMLDQIEDELRLELLGQMGPELERLIESRVHLRLEMNMELIMARTRDHLVTEVRRAVRDALDQVIGEEVKRLKKQPGRGRSK